MNYPANITYIIKILRWRSKVMLLYQTCDSVIVNRGNILAYKRTNYLAKFNERR